MLTLSNMTGICQINTCTGLGVQTPPLCLPKQDRRHARPSVELMTRWRAMLCCMANVTAVRAINSPPYHRPRAIFDSTSSMRDQLKPPTKTAVINALYLTLSGLLYVLLREERTILSGPRIVARLILHLSRLRFCVFRFIWGV